MPKFPKTIYVEVTPVQGVDDEYLLAHPTPETAAEIGHTVKLGVYTLTDTLTVTGVVDVKLQGGTRKPVEIITK